MVILEAFSRFTKSTFGIFILSLFPAVLFLYFYESEAQDFLDNRYFGVGVFVAFILTYLIYHGEAEFRKTQDMAATWIAILMLFSMLILYKQGIIDRNLFGTYFLWYLLIIFWDWKRI